jgi:hypothetical protein
MGLVKHSHRYIHSFQNQNEMKNIIKKLITVVVISITTAFSLLAQPHAQVNNGDKKDGGIVYWIDGAGSHGLIAYPKDLDEANKACKELGAGWRLPTKDELDKLYQAKDLHIFSSYCAFQSSSESELNHDFVRLQSLSSGRQFENGKSLPASTCAVRDF